MVTIGRSESGDGLYVWIELEQEGVRVAVSRMPVFIPGGLIQWRVEFMCHQHITLPHMPTYLLLVQAAQVWMDALAAAPTPVFTEEQE